MAHISICISERSANRERSCSTNGASPYFNLPPELARKIYDYILEDLVPGPLADVALKLTSRAHFTLKDYGSLDPTKILDDPDPAALWGRVIGMLTASKTFNKDIGLRLLELIPLHLRLEATVQAIDCEGSPAVEFNPILNFALPARTKRLYLSLRCTARLTARVYKDGKHVWLEDLTERQCNEAMVASPSFRDFTHRLTSCELVETLYLDARLTGGDFCLLELDPDDHQSHLIYQAMLAAVEQMPKLKRYYLQVGNFSMLAIRRDGKAWNDEKVFRESHSRLWVQHQPEYYELERELHML
ncbi:hypothetical protein Slin15195_G081010 [Septoria linicola]|uniref:Uncharacterized protein n=1 Tax=Septoria linicola TaxID=215465 RepID=A0A9Q9ELT8_9PEZI|nr:hypothetical protein Slin14017_G042220 [Septoria linicola]USW54782.1 hypothetical protein Slin15195_G081010 [Septoria linicola]